jgi:uncharacterized LabA/DUF88 family protein
MRGIVYLDLDNFPATAPYEKALNEFHHSKDLRILARKAFGDVEQLARLPLESQQSHTMIPCPKLTKTKNSTDMRLTVEVMKDLLTNESVDVFIIASADTDYIPVMKEVKERGKECIILTNQVAHVSPVLTSIADQLIICEQSATKVNRDKHSRSKLAELLGRLFSKSKESVLPISGLNDYFINNGYNFKAHGYVSFRDCMNQCINETAYTIDFDAGTIESHASRGK